LPETRRGQFLAKRNPPDVRRVGYGKTTALPTHRCPCTTTQDCQNGACAHMHRILSRWNSVNAGTITVGPISSNPIRQNSVDYLTTEQTGSEDYFGLPTNRELGGSVSTTAFVENNRACAVSGLQVFIRLGPAFEVEDWYVRSGGRRHLCL